MNGHHHNPAGPVARIDRFARWTDALDQLSEFYAGQLGAHASPVHQRPDGRGRAVLLDICGVGLELIERSAGVPSLGCAHLAFALGSADAVDRVTGRLAAAGHPLIEPPRRTREGRYQSALLDPDGNRIELTV